MVTMDLSVDIAATPARAWQVMADLEHAAERIQGIERIEIVTDGPVGVGTTWRETRIMLKKETTEVMKIIAWEPGSHYTVSSDSCGSDFVWTTRVTPAGDGSRLSMEIHTKARTLMAKLMTPLTWLMAGLMKKCVQKDLDDLKAFIERTPATDS